MGNGNNNPMGGDAMKKDDKGTGMGTGPAVGGATSSATTKPAASPTATTGAGMTPKQPVTTPGMNKPASTSTSSTPAAAPKAPMAGENSSGSGMNNNPTTK